MCKCAQKQQMFVRSEELQQINPVLYGCLVTSENHFNSSTHSLTLFNVSSVFSSRVLLVELLLFQRGSRSAWTLSRGPRWIRLCFRWNEVLVSAVVPSARQQHLPAPPCTSCSSFQPTRSYLYWLRTGRAASVRGRVLELLRHERAEEQTCVETTVTSLRTR